MLRGATFDKTGVYRYHLWREWDDSLPAVTFVMLNPSTADAEQDDPTIRRCIGFAHTWGYGRLEVVNLFAYRAPSPRDLAAAAEPFGDDNHRWLGRAVEANRLVLAWGNRSSRVGNSLHGLRDGFWRDSGTSPWCLGLTKLGEPRHPLYLSSLTPRVRFAPPQSPSR